MSVYSCFNEMAVTGSGHYLNTVLNLAHVQSTLYGQGLRPVVRSNTIPTLPLNITAANSDLRIYCNDGSSSSIKIVSLPSGSNLDARMLGRYVTDQIHSSPPGGNTSCWSNLHMCWSPEGGFEIKSGLAGANSQISVQATSNSAASTLGFIEGYVVNGSDLGRSYAGAYTSQGRLTNVYNGGLTNSGIYTGGGYDEYTMVAVEKSYGGGGAILISHPSGTYPGNPVVGGIYNYHKDSTLYVSVVASGGSAYMNGLSTTCPYINWYMITPTASGGVDPYLVVSSGNTPLLYPDYPVNVGGRGLWVKFPDYPFSTHETFVFTCSGIAKGANYTAGQSERCLIWSSLRGDTNWAPTEVPSAGSYMAVGKYGLNVSFAESYPIESGDTFRCIVPGPTLYSFNQTSINLGSITVSTTSRVFCVTFNIMGGAVKLTNVKFGLLSDAGMIEHNGVDTAFTYGTVGAGQEAVDGALHWQWRDTVVKTDLTALPVYLYAISSDLQPVSTADDSKTVGVNSFDGLMSDYIFNAIRLGANESGAKTVSYRVYFDYS